MKGLFCYYPNEQLFECDDQTTIQEIVESLAIPELSLADHLNFFTKERVVFPNQPLASQDLEPFPSIIISKIQNVTVWFRGNGFQMKYYTSFPFQTIISSFFKAFLNLVEDECCFDLIDQNNRVYSRDHIIPFNGLPNGTELTIIPHIEESDVLPHPNDCAEGIIVKVASDFCSKEIQFDFAPETSSLKEFVQYYLDEMVRNVNISNANDCKVYVDGSEQELDLETPLCTIIDGKHLNLHISRKTKRTSLASDKLACMVVLNNLVSGNTVYYKTQLLSYKLTESKILEKSSLPPSTRLAFFSMAGQPIHHSDILSIQPHRPLSITHFKYTMFLPPPFVLESIQMQSPVPEECFNKEFQYNEMSKWMKNLIFFWSLDGYICPQLRKAAEAGCFSHLLYFGIACQDGNKPLDFIKTYPVLPQEGEVLQKAHSLYIPYRYIGDVNVISILDLLRNREVFPKLKLVFVDTKMMSEMYKEAVRGKIKELKEMGITTTLK